MTDSTPPPPDPPKTRRQFVIPEEITTDVHAWAVERGLTDNGAFCFLLRSALILVIHDPGVMPDRLTFTGAKRRRSYDVPDHILRVLTAWANTQDISDNVAACLLLWTVRRFDDQHATPPLPTTRTTEEN